MNTEDKKWLSDNASKFIPELFNTLKTDDIIVTTEKILNTDNDYLVFCYLVISEKVKKIEINVKEVLFEDFVDIYEMFHDEITTNIEKKSLNLYYDVLNNRDVKYMEKEFMDERMLEVINNIKITNDRPIFAICMDLFLRWTIEYAQKNIKDEIKSRIKDIDLKELKKKEKPYYNKHERW